MVEESKQDKKKYWLKLDKDFMKSPQMKVIRNMPNGKDYIIFYLSLMLESVETVGHLRFTSLVPYNAEMLSSVTDTNVDVVRSAIKLFCELGMMQIFDDGTIFMTEVPKITGKESESAERVRKYREKQKQDLLQAETKTEPKDNATRQRQFRAKKKCEEQHIPLIEDYVNNKRYSGNYYIVIQRDRYKCSICGSIENLCVHHIDGYDENKPENNNVNKMITLCRKCHSNIHSGQCIDEDLLDAIEYNSNKMLPCNMNVTKCNDNKEKDKNKNKYIDKYKELFELFWKVYPKKRDKGNTEKWFEKNRPSEELVSLMIKQVKRFKDTEDWKKENGQFIPYPTTWLNGKMWEDEFETITEHEERLEREILDGIEGC